MRKTSTIIACLILSACTHNLKLMSQNSGNMGYGVANENGKTVTITLNGETYKGNYSFVQDGMIGFGSSFTQGAAYSANSYAVGNSTANSTYFSQSAVGNGIVLASSDSGKGLRCQFAFSSMESSGNGICRDDEGNLYDLQIN